MKFFHFLSITFLSALNVPVFAEKVFPELDKADALEKISGYLDYDCLQITDREFVTVKRSSFSLSGIAETETYGWRDARGVTHFPDGSLAGDQARSVDFGQFCDRLLSPDAKTAEENADVFHRMDLTANPSRNQIPPALAALWLHRQGKGDQAAKMWKLVQKDLERSRSDDAKEAFLGVTGSFSPWYLFNRAVSAHMYDEGKVALTALERLAKIHPGALDRFGAGGHLLTDLKRREEEQRLNAKSPMAAPGDFAKWDAGKKVAFLIKDLDQVNARQWGQPGGVSFTDDWRIRELIALGDESVAPLIDCFEMDDRLTKSVHYWRNFHQSRTVLSVREAALSALMSILQVPLFEAGSTGDNFTSRENKNLRKMVKSLRDYWKKNAGIDREQRFMNIITDQAKSMEDRFRAINSLAWIDHTFGMSTMVFSDFVGKKGEFKKHPLIDRFKNPSLAEAIWKIALETDNDGDWNFCLSALAKIKDPRVSEAIKGKFQKQKTLGQQVILAKTVSQLGDDELMTGLALGLSGGSISYSKADLGVIINTFSSRRIEACDRFLMTLADKRHPHYRETLLGLLDSDDHYVDEDASDPFSSDRGTSPGWSGHPFVIRILRQALEDESLTIAYRQLDESGSIDSGNLKGRVGTIFGATWEDHEKTTKEKVVLRICDMAAGRLGYYVEGIPFYSPLLVDRDAILEKVREEARKELHELPQEFADYLGGEGARFYYLTVPEVMTRAAEKADVANGLAAFSLGAGGEMMVLELPAFGKTIPEIPGYSDSRKVIVVQAERRKEGEEFYGCLTEYGLEKIPAREVTFAK